MKLKLLTKKKKKGNCIIMGAGGQAAGKSTTEKKKINPVAVESAHSTKYTENSSPAITQQLPLQFIKRHHIKA